MRIGKIEALKKTPPESVNFAELSDYQAFHINSELLELPPDYVTADLQGVSEPAVLRPIFHAFNDVTGQKLDEGYIDAMIGHEGEHWRAARALGAIAGRIVVRVTVADVIDDKKIFGVQPFTRPEDFRTTKLGHAAMTARPKSLSETDIDALSRMGYPNIFDLVKKIIEHNDNSGEGQIYPIPLMLDREQAEKIFLHK